MATSTRRRYDTAALVGDVFAVLLGAALLGVLLDSWRLPVVAALLMLLVALAAVVLLGLGQTASRPMPNEVDR